MHVYCYVRWGRNMKKTFLLFTLLLVSVMTTACINKFAVEELNNKAVKYLDSGDSETAICRLKSSLDLDEEFYQTHYNLSLAYNSLGNYEGAIQEAERVLELKPDFYDAIYVIAYATNEMAMKLIDKPRQDENSTEEVLTPEEMIDFNNKAEKAIELYNEYLVKKVNAVNEKQINERIEELNEFIKEHSYKLEAAEQNTETTVTE